MTTMTTSTRERHPWIAFVTASTLVMIGIYFLVAKLDGFLVAALMPLAACLALMGAHAQRHGDWPSRWPYWIVAALVAGLAIYGLEYWLYNLAHPPVAV
jgi:drug/metabolite transporter (DMT)-like permease